MFLNSSSNKGEQGRERMPYCPKCGSKVDEAMDFCPHCGTSLKNSATPSQAPPTQCVQNEKHEKNTYSFVGYLMAGLILITVGVFAVLDLTNPSSSIQDLSAMLLITGAIIIGGSVYMAIAAGKLFPRRKLTHPSTPSS